MNASPQPPAPSDAALSWPTITSIDEISGWFTPMDQAMFRHVLGWQQQTGTTGTVVELGCFMGKSTVVIGEYVAAEERFVVIDLFGRTDLLDGASEGNRSEVEGSSYQWSHGQAAFEHNYRCLHDGDLPEVVAGLSSSVADHVEPGTVRFCHIDASHDYEAVKTDIEIVSRLMVPGGVVVLDDYRTEHTPGVAAAAWGAVRDGLVIPVALSTQKMYGVFSEPEPLREAFAAALAEDRRWLVGSDVIDGNPVLRTHYRRSADEAKKAAIRARGETLDERAAREAAERAAAAEAERVAEQQRVARERQQAQQRAAAEAERRRLLAESRTLPRRLRRVAIALLPPVVSSGLRRGKHALTRHRG